MAEAGARLAAVLAALRGEVRAGIATGELEARARTLIREYGAKPAFLNYHARGMKRPFPAALCVSVNEVVVHGIPGPYALQEGDIVKLDLGLQYKGWYVDSAITVGVGAVDADARRLILTTERALHRGIREARAGRTVGDIGWAIQDEVIKSGFSVAKSLTGHGIGREVHEDPAVHNTGTRGGGEALRPGMVIAIEPMVALGKGDTKELPDESFVMRDGSRSAHFEHTVAVTEKGPRVLTAGLL